MIATIDAPAAAFRCVFKRRGSTPVLDGFDLTFARGEITALLGPNGAGKSTIVGLATGQLSPDRGQVRLMGADPRMPRSRGRLGVMLQEAALPSGLTVREQIDLFRGYYARPRPAADIVALAGLSGLERRRCSALSGGQQRRLQFALAICGRPDVLVLDEPTTGMDLEARRALWAALRAEVERGASALLTTHYLEEAEALADRIVVLARGRVVADGPPRTIKAGVASGVVRCRTRLTDAELHAIQGVISVTRQDGMVVVPTREPKATLGDLLARDPDLDELSLTGASLEEAFDRLLSGAAGARSDRPDPEPAR